MKAIPLDKAVDLIPNGATLMIGGFMGVGTPEPLIDELVRQEKHDLTVIANDTASPGIGIGKLVGAKLLGKASPEQMTRELQPAVASGKSARTLVARCEGASVGRSTI